MDALRALDERRWDEAVRRLRAAGVSMCADDVLCEVGERLASHAAAAASAEELLDAGLPRWLGDALRESHVSCRSTRALAAAVGALASKVPADALGERCVKPLARVWLRSRGAMVEAARALEALCVGSRANRRLLMHARGVLTASMAMRQGGAEATKVALSLLGHMSSCVPDVRRGGVQLVPVVRRAMADAGRAARHDVLVQALSVVRAVGQAWFETGDGFELGDTEVLCDAIYDACAALPRRDVCNAAVQCVAVLVEARVLDKAPDNLLRLTRDVANGVVEEKGGRVTVGHGDAAIGVKRAVARASPEGRAPKRPMAASEDTVTTPSKRQCTRFGVPRKRVKRARWSDVGKVEDEQGAGAGAGADAGSKVKAAANDEDLPSPTRVLMQTTVQ